MYKLYAVNKVYVAKRPAIIATDGLILLHTYVYAYQDLFAKYIKGGILESCVLPDVGTHSLIKHVL